MALLLCMVSLQAQTLLIYGGSDHDVFLGKLNADCYDSESIWNEYGTYGSKYSSKSIWNEYGTYGSEYSSYSPWNEYASTPPVVVDSRGNFYGYLKRIHLPTLLLKIGRFHMPPLQANT